MLWKICEAPDAVDKGAMWMPTFQPALDSWAESYKAYVESVALLLPRELPWRKYVKAWPGRALKFAGLVLWHTAPSLLIAVISAVANIKTMPVPVMMKIPLEAQNILHAPDMANKARKWVGDWHLEKTIATIKARVEGAYHAL